MSYLCLLMNYVSILFAIFCSSFGLAQKSDSILWSQNRPLKIMDFKALPNFSTDILALSVIGYDIKPVHNNDTVKLTIINYFSIKESWFKKESKSLSNKGANLLHHEQGHFDINEIELRKLKKKLLELKGLDFSQFKVKYLNLIKEYEILEFKIQKNYDSETNLSKNKVKQKEWSDKLKKELKDLEIYSSSIIKIPLKK